MGNEMGNKFLILTNIRYSCSFAVSEEMLSGVFDVRDIETRLRSNGEVYIHLPEMTPEEAESCVVIYHYYGGDHYGDPSRNLALIMQLSQRLALLRTRPHCDKRDGPLFIISYMPYERKSFSPSAFMGLVTTGVVDSHRHMMIHHMFELCTSELYAEHMKNIILPEDALDNVCFAFTADGYIRSQDVGSPSIESKFPSAWAKLMGVKKDYYPIINFVKKRESDGSVTIIDHCTIPHTVCTISDTPCTVPDTDVFSLDGKICIVSDDIIDSGQTLLSIATFLKNAGAAKVYAYITHAVLGHNSTWNGFQVKDVLDMVQNSDVIDKLYITDSIFYSFSAFDDYPKIEVIPLMTRLISKIPSIKQSLSSDVLYTFPI